MVLRFFSLLTVFFLAQACRTNTPPTPEATDRLQTYTPEDWDYWLVQLDDQEGIFRTYTPQDWDYWDYALHGHNGTLRTYTPEDWDYWVVDGGYTLRTYLAEDWDYWLLSGNGINITLRTYTPEDWDYWEITGDFTAKWRTYTPEDWDRWEPDGRDWASLAPEVQAALLFVPIFVSSIQQRGIHL